jgi:zinc transport system substrate-binding protein
MKKHFLLSFCSLLLILALISCNNSNQPKDRVYFVTSNLPLAFIIREITGDSASVISIMSPGESEHTFSPSPNDIKTLSDAKGVFYVSEHLDGWSVNLNRKDKYSLLDILPKEILLNYSHSHFDESNHSNSEESVDPHFWLDPIAVKAIVPELANILSRLNKLDSTKYQKNAELLIQKLNSINSELQTMLQSYKGRSVMLFHPSFLYFLKRYELNYAGAIEESPGKEPTARFLKELIDKVKQSEIRTLYIEPQLPDKSIKPVLESAGLKFLTLDPLGGYPGRDNYFDLIRFNARSITKGFN